MQDTHDVRLVGLSMWRTGFASCVASDPGIRIGVTELPSPAPRMGGAMLMGCAMLGAQFPAIIIDTAYDAFLEIDREGRILQWNRAAESTFGWPRAEVLDKRMAELILPARHGPAHRRDIEEFLAADPGALPTRQSEIEAQHRDGHEFPIELSIWRHRASVTDKATSCCMTSANADAWRGDRLRKPARPRCWSLRPRSPKPRRNCWMPCAPR